MNKEVVGGTSESNVAENCDDGKFIALLVLNVIFLLWLFLFTIWLVVMWYKVSECVCICIARK